MSVLAVRVTSPSDNNLLRAIREELHQTLENCMCVCVWLERDDMRVCIVQTEDRSTRVM